MAGTFTSLSYHLVFSTKDRFPMIHGGIQERLYEFIGGIIRRHDSLMMEIGGMPDHVHILARIAPKHPLSDLIRALKSKSSGWIHEQFPEASKFAWQEGYGAFTVSKSDIPRVREYIRGQSEHHRKVGFQEEFRKFLELHEIEFDENHLW